MSTIPWNAYYYDGLETSSPPTRTEVIEAECENDAAQVARSHMGRSKRVEIVGPRWANSQSRVIVAGDDARGLLGKRH
jgi:hypothetical protein